MRKEKPASGLVAGAHNALLLASGPYVDATQPPCASGFLPSQRDKLSVLLMPICLLVTLFVQNSY